MRNNIIINADDFGLKSSVNLAIVELFRNKIIHSATLMANMPGFHEAVELIHKYKLEDQIGIHLVLTEGLPLTEDIKSIKFLFNDKACSRKMLWRHLFFLNKTKKEIIFNEFAAQIKKIRKNGIPITHFDTHQQIHDFFGITQILIKLSRTYNIPKMRILNNLERSSQAYKNVYRNLINLYIKRNNANHTDYFGNSIDFQRKLGNNLSHLKEKSVEIMVHPDYSKNKEIIDKIKGQDYNFDFQKNLNNLLSLNY